MKINVDNATIEIPNFDRDEFKCSCCNFNNIKDNFLWKLQLARTEAQTVFRINSGSRCEKHNKEEGGKKTSDHLTGEGVDIEALTSAIRWKIVTAALNAGIRRIGIAKTFIHLGDNWNNPQNVMWVY